MALSILQRVVAPWSMILRQLREKGSASTFERLLISRHVADLRLIFYVSVGLSFVSVLAALANAVYHSDITSVTAFVGAVTLAAGTVLSWSYQTGSRRLGVVDLFASEISAICRVFAIVDLGPRVVAAYRQTKQEFAAAPHPAHVADLSKFSAAEDYTPVFDNEVADLEVLDAVVVNRVTEFYTYRKVMLDYMRRVANEKPFGTADRPDDDAWHVYMLQAIYMLFLASESGRLAVHELIEFEPNRAESEINILLTELPTYAFLVTAFGSQDVRGQRLALRRPDYLQLVPALYRRTVIEKDAHWARAKTTAAGLKVCFEQAFGRSMD